MYSIHIYRDCLADNILLELKLQYKNANLITCKELNVIDDTLSSCNNNFCIISLEQILNFNKTNFITFLDKLEFYKYIILVQEHEAERVKRLLKTGGKSFLLIDDPIELIVECIDNTIKYGGYISPRIINLSNKGNQQIINAQYKFSFRHREVLSLLLSGKSDKMIADTLNISYHTMKTHRKILYKLLGVNSQGEMFALLN